MEHADDAERLFTVVLADDHTVMRRGLRMLLEAERDLHVVAEAGTIQSVFREVRTHRPDVLVLDLNMPGGSSLEAISRLSRISPGTAIVVLTMEDDAAFEREALAAGARGYVLKDAAETELLRTINRAVAAQLSAHRGARQPSPDRSLEPPRRW